MWRNERLERGQDEEEPNAVVGLKRSLWDDLQKRYEKFSEAVQEWRSSPFKGRQGKVSVYRCLLLDWSAEGEALHEPQG